MPTGRISDINYSGSAAGQRFHMEFVALRNQVRTAAGISPSRTINLGRAGTLALGGASAKVVQRELKVFGEEVVLPTYRAFAPVSEGQGHELLRDTLRIIGQDKSSLAEIRLSMGWWGKLTSEGRMGLRTLPVGKAYAIHLPGGQVIFRRKVGPATRRAFSTGELAPWEGKDAPGWRSNGKKSGTPTFAFPPVSSTAAKERMDWGKEAWRTIKERGILDVLARNIGARLLANKDTRSAFAKVAIAFASLDTSSTTEATEQAMRRALGSFSSHTTETLRNINVSQTAGKVSITHPGRGKYFHIHQAKVQERRQRMQARLETARKRAQDAYDAHVKIENRRAAKIAARHGKMVAAEVQEQKHSARSEARKAGSIKRLMHDYQALQDEINSASGIVHANWMSKTRLKRPGSNTVYQHDTKPGDIARQIIRHRAVLKHKAAKIRAELKRLGEDSNLP